MKPERIAQHRLARDDATLAWTEEGCGPALIWAHGLMSNSYSLEQKNIYDFGPVIAAGSRLVRYDARGHGRSMAEAVPSHFTWSHLAGDLLAIADQTSADQPVSAMGCSMGTGTILHAATAVPARFAKLVLTAPPTAWKTRRAQAYLYEKSAATIDRDGQPALDALVANMAPPPIFTDLPEFPVEVNINLLPSILRGVGQSDLPSPDAIRQLDLPVLILAWESDPTHPIASAERLAELIPGAKLHVAKHVNDVRNWGNLVADFLA
jgi:pimeloyl-ACP methyl ester carboxylesterase